MNHYNNILMVSPSLTLYVWCLRVRHTLPSRLIILACDYSRVCGKTLPYPLRVALEGKARAYPHYIYKDLLQSKTYRSTLLEQSRLLGATALPLQRKHASFPSSVCFPFPLLSQQQRRPTVGAPAAGRRDGTSGGSGWELPHAVPSPTVVGSR